MAKKKPPVSQSRTMWVKKGTIVNGEEVKKGYVAQYGKPEKRVTNRVKLEVDTPKRGKKGDVVTLKAGRYVTKKPGSGATGGAGTGGAKATPTKPKGQTMAQAGASAGRRQAAMATDRRNSASITPPARSTSMGRPGQKPAGAKAYAAAREQASRVDSRGLPKSGRPGQVITKNGKKYRWTSSRNLWQPGKSIQKTEGWVEFK